MTPNPDFWSERKVLLTGHTGFKGAWMACWLARLGARTTGLALAPDTDPNLHDLLHIDKEMATHVADLNDAEKIRSIVHAERPEIVIHMAAQALLPRSYREPALTWRTNVMGTINLLDALRDCEGVEAVLVVTSDKVYENPERGRAFSESDRLGGDDPYSSSKAATEFATAAWRRSFFPEGAKLATARAGNVIGGGDWAGNRLVPDLMRAVTENSILELRDPSSVRPWQHVLDVLSGYFGYLEGLAANKDLPPSLNFGPSGKHTVTVEEVVEKLLSLMGASVPRRHAPSHDIREKSELVLDSALASETLGWESRLDMEKTLEWTAEWYRAWLAGGNPRDVTERQIDHYESLSS
ncbi:MAG: CDP-glucose 4,6-dehydratase [Alphaproteobacteria bacterium]|nr:CDP-glucose 4,6-dehydratase [Alphaproteobacteria bacterium]